MSLAFRCTCLSLSILVFIFSSLSAQCKGENAAYGFGRGTSGRLGDSTTVNRLLPTPVKDLNNVLFGKTIASSCAGDKHSMLLTTDGKLFGFGFNAYGQLGNGDYITQLAPVAVDMTGELAGKNVTQVTCGVTHTLVLTSDGKLFAFGWPSRIGNDTATVTNVPVRVDMTGVLADKTVIQISSGGGYHSAVLTIDGLVATFGDNDYGQLGVGDDVARPLPVLVDTSGELASETVTYVSAGYAHTMVTTLSGKVFGFGKNDYGQLGLGNQEGLKYVPYAVDMTGKLADKTVTQVAAGEGHTLVLTSEGRAYSFGWNDYSQLGYNGPTSIVPVEVDTSGELLDKTITHLCAGGTHSFVLTSECKAYGFGRGEYGQLGDNTTTERYTAKAIGLDNVTQIACGFLHTFVVGSWPEAVNAPNAPTLVVPSTIQTPNSVSPSSPLSSPRRAPTGSLSQRLIVNIIHMIVLAAILIL
jgi:alpha-tubulin suppressor-like RCC1 family protein